MRLKKINRHVGVLLRPNHEPAPPHFVARAAHRRASLDGAATERPHAAEQDNRQPRGECALSGVER